MPGVEGCGASTRGGLSHPTETSVAGLTALLASLFSHAVQSPVVGRGVRHARDFKRFW